MYLLTRPFRQVLVMTIASLFVVLVCPFALAQLGSDGDSTNLAVELQKLRSKVAALEVALSEKHQSRSASNPSMQQGSMTKMSMSDSGENRSASTGKKGMGMGGMKGMGGMQSMNQNSSSEGSSSAGMSMGMMGGSNMQGMGGMGMMSQGGEKGMSGMMSGMMGMGMMGRNPAMKSSTMSNMNMPSALPGFPGASHLYHIGETGFFLDHPEHITLTAQQQQQLNQIKEEALLATSTAKRKIDEAEQQLWTLTAEAQPDINKIESKSKEIAQLTVGNRIDFIRSVGKAAEVLTDEQRKMLVGLGSSEAKDPAHQH